jgi:uncharacterized protein YutE (UPF0331/DUF86 family)
MNERIRQLAEQATTRIEPTSNSGEGWIFDKEKFAELIVQECADLCNKFGDRLEDERPNKDLDIVAYECADGLKRYFGIKE